MNTQPDHNALHATYAPSSAHRWTACTASAEAIERLGEQEEGEEAAEGTRAHEELERCLKGGTPDDDHPAAFGIALALNYLSHLPGKEMWIEQRVALTEQIWGRCDVAHWSAPDSVLTILDLKNGMRAVDAEENEQLRIYAAASMFTHKLPVKWVRYVVVQPNDWRPFVPRVKQWVEPVADLYEWATRIASIPTSPLSFTAGEQCRDCPLFGKCDASQDMLANVGAVIAGLVSLETVPLSQRALFLTCKKPIEDAFKNAEKTWSKQALAGSIPDGMKLVEGQTKRAWKDEAKARAAVVAKGGIEALDPPTPAQAEAMGIDVTDLAHKPEGVPVLAFASDKRKPWARKSAAEMFARVTTS